MGLDIYVMPLWRFKVGDFLTPTEAALGVRSKLVVGNQIVERTGRFTRADEARARREVQALRRVAELANQVPVQWDDEGSVVYAQQSEGIEPLRAYARWLDLREQLPSFDSPPEGNYYRHPAMGLRPTRPLSCPHLVEHDCYSGYYLPCEFDQLVRVEPYEVYGRRFRRSVGSGPRLRRELDFIGQHLPAPDGYTWQEGDPLAPVKAVLCQMRQVAELSCRHGLPIIFWG